jgi:hypothetical protein
MKLLKGGDLRLVKDPDMNKDKYGRLLRYVYIDGRFVNKILAREGMAEVFFCRDGWESCEPAGDKQRKKEIERAGEYAATENLGVHDKKEKKLAHWKEGSQEYQSREGAEDEESENEEDKEGRKRGAEGGAAEQEIGSETPSSMPFHVRSGGGSSDEEDEEEKEDEEVESDKNGEDNSTRKEDGDEREGSGKDQDQPAQAPGGDDNDQGNNEQEKDDQEEPGEEDEDVDPSSSIFLTDLDVFDPVTENATYTASTTVKISIATTSSSSSPAVAYHLSTSSSVPATTGSKWRGDAPDEFIFQDDTQGERTIFARLMVEGELSTSAASSTILVDTRGPVSAVSELKENYGSYDIPVEWTGDDPEPSVGGAVSFDVEYRMSGADGNFSSSDWKVLASATTSTSTRFKYSTTTDNIIHFRSRAEDRAGNIGEWSDIASTSVIVDDRADHAVISRIHPAHHSDNQDFTNYWLELYNPTDKDIDLASLGYRVERTTGSSYDFMEFGNTDHGSFPGGTVIPAQEYYLIAEAGASEELKQQADAVIADDRSFALTENNAVSLAAGHVSGAQDEDIVDLVGYGTDAPFYEGNGPAPTPSSFATGSIQRKALATSTASKMADGAHRDLDAGYDSDDNEQDFVIQEIPDTGSTENNETIDLIASTQELIEEIEQNIRQDTGMSKMITIGTTSTTTLLQIATSSDYINTETKEVVDRHGKPKDSAAEGGSPEAPTQSDWVDDVGNLPESVVRMEITPDSITPSNFQVQAGQVVALSVTASEESVEILRFDDPQLSGVAVGVGSGYTRVMVFNAPEESGEYPYYSEMSGHRSQGAEGVMSVE